MPARSGGAHYKPYIAPGTTSLSGPPTFASISPTTAANGSTGGVTTITLTGTLFRDGLICTLTDATASYTTTLWTKVTNATTAVVYVANTGAARTVIMRVRNPDGQ